MNFLKLNKISKMGYFIAIITFFVRASHFMSLPFLAIYLTREDMFTSRQIGIVLGVSGLILSLTGLINGAYLDRNSHKFSLISALLLSGLCYFGFASSIHFFWALLLLNAALGWFRSLIEISLMSMMMNHSTPENLSYAYSARFIGANLGVAIGPLVGALMSFHQSLALFYIAGAIHCLLGLILLFYKEQPKIRKTRPMRQAVLDSIQVVFKDKLLVNITLINLILWTVYAQLDTTIPQFLAQTGKNPALLFSQMMFVNAIICVLLQPVIMRWAELNSLKKSAITGSILFVLSFFLIAASPSSLTMILSVILLSLAELCTLPINSLIIMRIAPDHLLASYNGFASLGLLGLSIGPIIGGYGLSYLGGNYTFLLNAILAMLAVGLYLKGPSLDLKIHTKIS